MEIVVDRRAILAESPLWHREEGTLYWVDIPGQGVFRLTDDGPETILDGVMVTAVTELVGGGLAMVTRDGVLSWRDGEVTPLLDLTLPDEVRPNDGKCGPDGRLWFGTMDLETRRPLGELFVCEGRSLQSVRSGIILSNGLGWSPNGEVFYHVDSTRRHIYRHDYDPELGVATNRTILFDGGVGSPDGPDGLAVDVDGNLWVAFFGGWRIEVLDPKGRSIHIEQLEVQKPTSVAFGGAALDRMYVTTASEHLSPDELAAQPDAGSIFCFDPGTRGVPVGVFEPNP